MVRKKQRGSITIFGALALVLTIECLLVLTEGARFAVINRGTMLQTQIAMDAVRASYCKLLWEEYHLLGTERSVMEDTLVTYGNGRTSELEWRKNLVNFRLEDLEIEGYTLITDGKGKAFCGAVSDYMEDNILYETAKMIYSQYEAIYSIMESDDSDLGDIDKALEHMENIQRRRSSTAIGIKEEFNPLKEVKELQKMGILEILVEDSSKISQKNADLTQSVSRREPEEGKHPNLPEGKWYDRILLQQYLLNYMSFYGNERDGHVLAYELEYLIGGKESDIENLKAVLHQVLLIRQAANMLYLFSDSVKVEEANTLALAITTALAVPEIYEAVGAAILTAWAYGESILDVRGLLQGKRIPLLKSADTWTLQLSGIGELSEGYATAKESEYGLRYSDYLGVLLLFSSDSNLSMRAMDMQEATIRSISGDEDFFIDHLVIRLEAVLRYAYQPVFGIFDTFTGNLNWNYIIERKVDKDVSLYFSSS